MSDSISKTDFLRFNCYSIKELITRKLSQDSKYTDQIYEGSNLAVLIDIVSYMYQCLIYQLNNAASESMFADTQLYENMIRLVKFLGYSPKGCVTASIDVILSDIDSEFQLANYVYVDTNLTDSNSKQIYFSVDKEDTLNNDQEGNLRFSMYNGQWKVYNTEFTASGNQNETFLLTGIKSDRKNGYNVPHSNIRVYVKEIGQDDWERWNYDSNGIFIQSYRKDNENNNVFQTLVNSDEKVFTLNLTQDKTYELVFGDGIIGKKLKKDSKIVVLYLDTNGKDGEIDISKVDFTKLKFQIPSDIKNLLDTDLKRELYGCKELKTGEEIKDYEEKIEGEWNYTLNINNESGSPVNASMAEESVAEIRRNAPNWFKTGYRLITKTDYENFIKNNRMITEVQSDHTNSLFSSKVIDVKCMNNVQYVTKFYKWLYMQGLSRSTPNGRYYFNGDFFNRNNYYFIDPSDANNIYLWIKTEQDYSTSAIENMNIQMNSITKNIKMTTTEINIVQPLKVYFDICASSREYALENYVTNQTFDEQCESTIEITLADDISFVSNSIQNSVYQIIVDHFNQRHITLGQTIDPTDITNKIYKLNGVCSVKTVWKSNKNDGMIKQLEGISFASWTDEGILDQYEDFAVGNNIRKLEDFQYPQFKGKKKLLDRIVVIKKQMNTVNTITF